MKDYSPFCLRIQFSRRCLAAYLSLTLLFLGAGIGRADDKKPFFNTPPEHVEKLACTPVPKSDNPVVQAMFDQAFPKAAASPPVANDAPEVILAETQLPPARSLEDVVNKAQGSQLVQAYQAVPMNLLKPQVISPVYSTYFKQAAELSRGNEDNRKQAVELFGKAIELDSKKSFQDSMKLDDVAKALYAKAYMAKAAPAIEESLKEKKSSWLVRNLPWLIPLAIAAGYGIYELVKPKSTTPVTPIDKDYKTTLTFEVINHVKGVIGTYTVPDIMTGTDYTVSIPDIKAKISIADKIDENHIIIRGPRTDCQFLAVNRHGNSASFKVDKTTQKTWNFSYTVLLLSAENNTNYALIDDKIDNNANTGKLMFAPNCTYWRAADLVTGSELAILTAVDQLNSALAIPGFTYGKISKVASNGDFRVYYTNEYSEPGNHGIDSKGNFAVVNPTTLKEYQMLFVWLEEIFELMTRATDFGGQPSHKTITDWQTTGNLNQTGIDLLCYVYSKDSQKIGATTNAQAKSTAMSAQIGDVNITVNAPSGEFGAGYKGKNVSVAAQRSRQGTNIAAGAQFDKFGANMVVAAMQGRTILNANGNANLEGIALAFSGMYDTAGANMFGINLANKPKGSQPQLQAGYERQTSKAGVQQAVNAQAAFNVPIGLIIVSGNYSTAEGMARAEQFALNLAAKLKLNQFGVLYVNGNYQRQQFGNTQFNTAGISVQKPFGPAQFDLGWNSVYGPRVSVSMTIPIN
jgi:hypothetical protein